MTRPTSFRLRQDVIHKLRVLATFEDRSMSNMLKSLIEQAYGAARYRLNPADYQTFQEAESPVDDDHQREPNFPTEVKQIAEYAGELFDALATETYYGFNLRIILMEASQHERAALHALIVRAKSARTKTPH